MRISLVMSLSTFLTLAALCSPGATQSTHVDEKWGFKIRVPEDFRKIPSQVGEQWIIGKYQSEKNYFTEKGWEFKPIMQMIIFPEERKKKKRVEVEEKKDEITIRWQQKYKDYKEFLKGNFAGGGYFFSKETEGKMGGVRVSQYEIKVEKLANTKQRIITWVYHLEEGLLRVELPKRGRKARRASEKKRAR